MDIQLRLGISPCPNDTFIFCGLINRAFDPGEYTVKAELLDIQELNQLALQGAFDLVKISIAIYPRIAERYHLLRSGAALGRGCGPLLLALRPTDLEALRFAKLAVPGTLTTANLLLQKIGFHQGELLAMRYDLIMEAILSGRVDAGVIIHEGRFTYAQSGLVKVLDLGQWWEQQTGLPIPLGGIAIRRSCGQQAAEWAEQAIQHSLDFAEGHPDLVWPYIRQHAQEMDDATISEHIQTFVNAFSRDLGPEGLRAIQELLRTADVSFASGKADI